MSEYRIFNGCEELGFKSDWNQLAIAYTLVKRLFLFACSDPNEFNMNSKRLLKSYSFIIIIYIFIK